MSTILDGIVAAKWTEIAAARQRVPEGVLERQLATAAPPRNFLSALRDPPGVQVIAEIKRASPSAGTIRENVDAVQVAMTYESGGAACLSVLTDAPYFGGHLDDLRRVRAQVSIPVLRKDFILERYQVLEARAAGADAVLLIAEILPDDQLHFLLTDIHRLGMIALVELYEPANLPRVLASGAKLIGINNRNLHTFETRLEHTLELASRVPSDRCLVSESGIRTGGDVERLRVGGVKAILVGETLMRAEDRVAKLGELLGRGA